MEIITDNQMGLSPNSKEIKMSYSCSDLAFMCKHIAATLCVVGARLDAQSSNYLSCTKKIIWILYQQ